MVRISLYPFRISVKKLIVFMVFALVVFWGPVPCGDLWAEGAFCPPEDLSGCYDQAKELYDLEDYRSASILFEKILEVDPEYEKAGKYLKKCQKKTAQEEEENAARVAAEQERLKSEEEARLKAEAKEKKEIEDRLAQEEKRKQEGEQARRETEPSPTPEVPAADIQASSKPAETVGPLEEAPKDRPLEAGQGLTYRISVGDVLEITVWRNADLDKNVIVRPDGVISYPLVGDIPAVGLSLTELDDKITEALKDYVRHPVVSIAIQRFGGIKIIVLGEVSSPGLYSPPGGGNIMDIIALAGGFTKRAVTRGTFVVRGGLASPEVYRLNLARVFKGDLTQNIPLQSNDIVYVPKRLIAKWNDVLAEISPTLSTTLLGTSVARDIKSLR